MARDNLLHNREPDAGAHFAGRLRALGSIELLEDVLDFLRVHSDPLVLNRETQLIAISFRKNANLSSGRRIFHRIGEQIVKRIFH